MPLRSLESKLPAAMAGILAGVVLLLTGLAYREVNQAGLEAARDRVQGVSRELAEALARGAAQRLQEARALARTDAVGRYLATSEPRQREAALAALRRAAPTGRQSGSTELWSLQKQVLVISATGHRPDSLGEGPGRWRLAGDSAAVLPFHAVGDSLAYDVAAAVVIGGVVRGYVVEHRPVAGAEESRRLIERLIGSGATFLVGNRDGSLWTDLTRKVEGPPPPLLEGSGLARYSPAAGEPQLGMAAAMPNAPWVVWVSLPEREVLGRSHQFLRDMALIAVIVLLVGVVAVRGISRRLTAPLRRLTSAAEAIAAGDYHRQVAVDRQDEVGRLVHAFNTMATHVEQEAAQRTADLEATLRELQDTQEELVRREKLAILGQLASGVGHELRNPLGVMTNALYYLDAVLKDPPPQVREYLGILRAQVGLSEKIVSDLLDFARTKTPAVEAVALDQLADQQLRRLAIPDGIEVEREYRPGLPPARVDAVQVGQVVFNLLTNAVQAMENGGRLVVRCGVDGVGQVRIDVSDTGPGMTPEIARKVFEPLFTTKARGIGLGLAVSRSLVEANGGRITLTTEPGRGSTFTVTLPAVAA